MFSLFLAKVHAQSFKNIVNSNVDSPKRETKQYINGIYCYDISGSNAYHEHLSARVDYCYNVYGSIFLNAKPVSIKGFIDGVLKFQGDGVFATLGENYNYNTYSVIIR